VSLKEKRADIEQLLGSGIVVETGDQKPPEPAHSEDV
jgi:hypothetical protein